VLDPRFVTPPLRGHRFTRRPTLRALGFLAAAAPLVGVGTAYADDDLDLSAESAEPVETPPELLDVPAELPAVPLPDVTKAALTPLEIQVLALVNGARAGRGLRPLEWDATMTAVAREHALDMMRHANVSHTGSDGSSPVERLRRAGLKFQFGSENIWTYWGNEPSIGPSTMHAAMMAEPFAPGLWNHVGNILYTGYRRIGVGLVVAAGGVQYLSETFAD
jgi:uncharacterized protein YkwD